MGLNSDNYSLLVSKLDKFIRKFYLNQLIRGLLYSVGLIVLTFILFNVLEHQFYFGMGTRKAFFYSFLGLSSLAILYWVLRPMSKYFSLGKRIGHEQAAGIIGDHFPDVKDKLLNILQLKKQSGGSQATALINASINQKSEKIKLVPFRSAINLNQNRKYLKYAIPPLATLFIILFAAPSIIKDSAHRIINNNRAFERAAPFAINIQNEDFQVLQYEDYQLDVEVDGEILPDEIYIDVDGYQYKLKKNDKNTFSYTFNNVHKDTEFKLLAGMVSTESQKLTVLKKPLLLGFDVSLDYPSYTGKKDERLSNIGDVVVPVGTKIFWSFDAQNTDNLLFKFSNSKEYKEAKRNGTDVFSLGKTAYRDLNYKVYTSNEHLPFADSVRYGINVIPDEHPSIKVERFADSTDAKLIFFVGAASDDYGLKKLTYNYQIKNEKNITGPLRTEVLSEEREKQLSYDYTLDILKLDLKPGDELTYYFEAWDNDGINGSKSAKTSVMSFRLPTLEEVDDQMDENSEDIKKKLEESLKESKEIKEEFKELREELMQEKELEWENKKEIEKLMQRHDMLQKEVQQAKEKFDQNMQSQEEFENPSEELLEKQEQINELFEELMDEEMKELMKKFEEMMEELEKEEALEMMEEMEMNDEELEKELDRLLELFKQLEVEQEMQEKIDELNKMAEEEEQLSEEAENDEKSNEQLEKEQEELNEDFEKLQEEMEELQKKNEELENPKEMGDPEEQMEDIKKDMEESSDELQKKQKQKASKKQKSAAGKMKQMAQQMQEAMDSGEQEQMEEDMAALRQLLENLVTLSFDQEMLINSFSKSRINTPKYVSLIQDQFKISDDFKIVEDSLQALSKRVFQIESFVTEKVTEVKENLGESLDYLEDRKKSQAGDTQQRTMKNLNDLALMLSEVMNQMQQSMADGMPGSQSCEKPGGNGSKPSDKISNAQDALNKSMQKMKDAMEKGKGMGSKGFAEMAARQAALRKALKELQKGKQEKGKGDKGLQDIIDSMDKTEEDLVNKRLTNEMLKRQQDIMTRLLEAEKADQQRELDNKRRAETAQQVERKMPPSLEAYLKKREAEIDKFKNVSPELNPFYKFLVEEYYKSLKSQ